MVGFQQKEGAPSSLSSEVSQAIGILSDICKDPQVPKGVKKRVEDVALRLGAKDRALNVKINSCTFLLDDISNDPSVPPHTRTFIWQVAGILESAGKKAFSENAQNGGNGSSR